MIDVQCKVIYTHPQKTGGTSIESLFTSSVTLRKHAHLHEHVNALTNHGENHAEYYKFSSTRNPWDAAVSHYHHDIKLLENHEEELIGIPRYDKIKEMDFEQYIRNMMFYGGDVKQFMFYRGKFAMNRVVRFEYIQQDFDEVCNDIGIEPVQLPHTNKTDHDHYTTYYTDETKRIVEKAYAADISFFNYKFEI